MLLGRMNENDVDDGVENEKEKKVKVKNSSFVIHLTLFFGSLLFE